MILQALVEHYEDLVAQGKLARPGWSDANISYALYINDAGELEQVVSLKREEERGKKKVLVPRPMRLPISCRKSSDMTANFLWDNSSYILGIDEKGKAKRSSDCFAVCKAFHHQLLDGADSPAARAVLAFFDGWNPEKAREHPALMNKFKDICSNANLVFRYDGAFLQEDLLIQHIWQNYYDADSDEGIESVCLVTGRREAIAKTHLSILGAGGTNPKLVSFDKDSSAFCSYGKTQGYNAPTGKYAAFSYASALNELLRNKEYVRKIGDTTVVFWAAGGQHEYPSIPVASLFGMPANYTLSDLQDFVLKICHGKPAPFDETRLNPNTNFYVLGLSPNNGRLSVRFFLKNSFGRFVNNIQKHYERLDIVRTVRDKYDVIYVPTLLDDVVNQKSATKLYDKLFGETIRAILTNTQYPLTLRNFAYLRIRADRDITRNQASVLKANLLKKYELLSPKSNILEVLQVDLNESCTYPPYLLGRLFSIMEQIQLASADWKINRTIKDSYFISVSATPKIIFSKLFPLNEYHLKKLKRDKFNLARKLEEEKSAIIALLNTPIPIRFTPDEVDCFYIGYYHQNCKKENEKKQKEENEHV